MLAVVTFLDALVCVLEMGVYMFKEKNSPHTMPHIHIVWTSKNYEKHGLLILASWIALNESGEVIKIKGIEV